VDIEDYIGERVVCVFVNGSFKRGTLQAVDSRSLMVSTRMCTVNFSDKESRVPVCRVRPLTKYNEELITKAGNIRIQIEQIESDYRYCLDTLATFADVPVK